MASKGIGRLVQVGVAKEVARGTAQGSASYWTPWNDLTLDEKKEFAVDAQSLRRHRGQHPPHPDEEVGAGLDRRQRRRPEHRPHPLFHVRRLRGTRPIRARRAVYDHSFTVGQSAQHQSLTFFLHDPLAAVDYSYANGVVEKLELNMALKKFIEYTPRSSRTPALAEHFSPHDRREPLRPAIPRGQVRPRLRGPAGHQDGDRHLLDLDPRHRPLDQHGVAARRHDGHGHEHPGRREDRLDRLGQLRPHGRLDRLGDLVHVRPGRSRSRAPRSRSARTSRTRRCSAASAPADFLNKEFSVEGTFEAIWQNESDFKTPFMAPDILAMRLDMKNTDVTLGSSTNPELYIDLPKCTIQELGRPFKVKDLVYQHMKFKAVYSVTDTMMAKMVADQRRLELLATKLPFPYVRTRDEDVHDARRPRRRPERLFDRPRGERDQERDVRRDEAERGGRARGQGERQRRARHLLGRAGAQDARLPRRVGRRRRGQSRSRSSSTFPRANTTP